MKKFTFSFLSFLLLGSVLISQNYYYILEDGTLPPYRYDETEYATDIMTSGNEVISSSQNLPFTWTFYGQGMSSYKVSDNGYITFDASASVSVAANTNLPSAAGPNNAIYAFWDDLDVSGGKIRKWDYGVAPNRIHCIQWQNVARVGSSFRITTTIRLHEAGDFDIIHDMTTGSPNTSTNGSVGVENSTGTTGFEFSTNPNFVFPALTNTNYDDAVYAFTYGTQQSLDLTVLNTNVKQTMSPGTTSISGEVKNMGFTSVTQFRMNFQLDGGAVNSQSITTFSLPAYGGEESYYFITDMNLPNAGTEYELKLWADNLNGQNDQFHPNDTLTMNIITVLGNNAAKKVIVEEYTATWCGACPTGLALMDTLYNHYPNQVLGVANHASDGFSFTNTMMADLGVSGIPDGSVDRSGSPFGSDPLQYPTTWPQSFANRLLEPVPVDIRVYNVLDQVNGIITGQVVAEFVDYSIGDMRMVLFVVENDLAGTQSGIGAYTFDHILRAFPLGEYGTPGTIPTSVVPGQTYVENFTFNVDPSWVLNNVQLYGAVLRYSIDKRKNEFINADDAQVNNGVGIIKPLGFVSNLEVSPVPASGMTKVSLELPAGSLTDISVINVIGQDVLHISNGVLRNGSHTFTFDASNMKDGVYFVRVRTEKGVDSHRFVVTK